jgi:predicted TIM-barrel fold metal-dependent hydrolase
MFEANEHPSAAKRVSGDPAISRRDLLKTLGVAGAAAAVPVGGLIAQATRDASSKRGRIDVHHHMLPPFQDGGNRNWTPQVSLDAMDKFGVDTAILSVTMAPCCGVADLLYAGDEKANALARRYNEFGAKVVSDHPKRFGFMMALPLMDTDATLKEIEYAFDVLKADGVGVFSNTGEKWLGDPQFMPIFQELNRRKAVIFIHPSVAKCCRTLIPGVGTGVVEFDFDTTRTVVSLLYSGRLSQNPDIRFIINHSGAAVPTLAGRIKDELRGDPKHVAPNGAFAELTKLYYECAHATYPAPIAATTTFASTSQLLFGTDFPIWPYETTVSLIPALKLSPETTYALDRGNAERLFPRWKAI